MQADYRAEMDRLETARALLAPLRDDPELGHLACYWAGFANWRLVLNMPWRPEFKGDRKAMLLQALEDFEASIARHGSFADAHAAAAALARLLV